MAHNVFHPDRDGNLRPLASLWQKTHGFIRGFFSAVRLLEVPPIRKVVQAALAKPEHEMQFVRGRGREVLSQWTKAYGSAFFPDTYDEVNGVANTSRQFEAFAQRRGLPFLIVCGGTSDKVEQTGSVRNSR